MKCTFVLALAALFVLIAAPTVFGQGAHEHPQQAQAGPPAGAPPPSPQGPGGPVGGMMPMAMCQEMMRGAMMGGGNMGGGNMGMPMMGGGMMRMPMMGGGAGMDPKMMGHMMEMRADMMKAMADVMLKHARRMQESPAK
jgi:hypothetical protein